MQSNLEKKVKKLPDSPGVYLYKNINGEIIYIGKANNLKNRVKSYFQKRLNLGPKTRLLVENISDIDTINVDSEIEALLLEANLIQKYQPKFNFVLKDNSSYPYIKITVNETFPKILQTRKIEKDKARYFGPYTDIKALRYILKELRLMFSPHLYFFTKEKNPLEYNKCIKNIILFLEGKKDLLLKKLTMDMIDNIENEDFEKANEAKIQIEKIRNLTKPNAKPFEYLKNPNLMEDQINLSLLELAKTLNLKSLKRIECYDIATLQGKSSTGSMIVFTDGIKDTNEYRKFKIIVEGNPNDYQLWAEILKRRFSHFEWPAPDLLVIDGGKGQLSTAEKVLKNLQIKLPIIALAKREEEIYINRVKIRLERTSGALKLLQRVRDEAHRFAASYHKILRLKSLTINK